MVGGQPGVDRLQTALTGTGYTGRGDALPANAQAVSEPLGFQPAGWAYRGVPPFARNMPRKNVVQALGCLPACLEELELGQW